jgi:hypothetical protein
MVVTVSSAGPLLARECAIVSLNVAFVVLAAVMIAGYLGIIGASASKAAKRHGVGIWDAMVRQAWEDELLLGVRAKKLVEAWIVATPVVLVSLILLFLAFE